VTLGKASPVIDTWAFTQVERKSKLRENKKYKSKLPVRYTQSFLLHMTGIILVSVWALLGAEK
jgi:hypothetical protein